MSSKKNAREKAQARREAETRARHKRTRNNWIAVGMLLVGLWAGLTVRAAFGADTCGPADGDAADWLAQSRGQAVTVLKTAREGRVQAVLYEEDSGTRSIAVFERRLLGLRWAYEGMNDLPDRGLALTGRWNAGGFLSGSKCDIQVYGDNRDASVDAYAVTDSGVGREHLEADYILDIYVLDGIGALPKELEQSGPGTPEE